MESKAKIKALSKRLVIILVLLSVSYKAITATYGYLSGRYSCHLKWVESGYDYKYTFRAGCLINKGDKWIPVSNFRID